MVAAPQAVALQMASTKSTATPALSQKARGKKRERPSDASDLFDMEPPVAAVRKTSGSNPTGSASNEASDAAAAAAAAFGLGGEGIAYRRKGMYLAFIDDALAQRYKGNNKRYEELIGQFRALLPLSSTHTTVPSTSNPAPTASELRSWLDALTHVVSKLDKSHAPLVETIITVPWATMEDAFVAAYVRFVGALVSARAEWLKAVIDKCVKGFRYRSQYTIEAESHVTRRKLYDRLHTLIRVLLSLVPTLSSALSPIIAQHFPPKRENQAGQICYINNMLTMSEYCPAVNESVLSLIVERAAKIDVEIQGEMEDWAEDAEESGATGRMHRVQVADLVDKSTSDLVDDEDSSDDDDGLDFGPLSSGEDDDDSEDDASKAKRPQRSGMSEKALKSIRQSALRLDAILKVVFDHLAASSQAQPSAAAIPTESRETTPTPVDPLFIERHRERRASLFRTLLDIFDRTLLRTFKARHTQFLLFYMCSLDSSSSDHFIGVLLSRALFELDAPSVTRIAASSYVASFISRATFVDAATTRKVVKLLCEFLDTHMDPFTPGSVQQAPVFYAVTQAVMYVFCFRWKDLLDERDEEELVLEPSRHWVHSLDSLKKSITSMYNPLNVCAKPVVTQFAAIAHSTSFFYCYSLIAANKRYAAGTAEQQVGGRPVTTPVRSESDSFLAKRPTLPTTSSAMSTPATSMRKIAVPQAIETFFPFDPFKLPMSSAYIDGIYREWEGNDEESSSSDGDDDDDADGTSESEIDTEDDAATPHPQGLEVPGAEADKRQDREDEVASSLEAMSL